MSTWRRKALELFPDLRNEIQHGEATIYTVFFVLRPRCHRAHLAQDVAELQKIYDYAEWCFRQKAKDLWNAAGVAFYEHLGDEAATRDEMHLWVKRDIFDDVAGLLEYMMKQDDFANVRAQFYPSSKKRTK
jgi:hypothetical protein